MTKERNETNVGAGRGDRQVIIRNTIYGDEINLAIKEDDDFLGFAYMKPENAYALVDWITENVERPRVKSAAEIAFDEIELGTAFGFFHPDTAPSNFPYIKTGEKEYKSIRDGFVWVIKEEGERIPKPKPLTVKDKIDALKIGAKFSINGGTSVHFIKTGESAFVRVSNKGGYSQFYGDAYGPGSYSRWVTDFETEVTEVN